MIISRSNQIAVLCAVFVSPLAHANEPPQKALDQIIVTPAPRTQVILNEPKQAVEATHLDVTEVKHGDRRIGLISIEHGQNEELKSFRIFIE